MHFSEGLGYRLHSAMTDKHVTDYQDALPHVQPEFAGHFEFCTAHVKQNSNSSCTSPLQTARSDLSSIAALSLPHHVKPDSQNNEGYPRQCCFPPDVIVGGD